MLLSRVSLGDLNLLGTCWSQYPCQFPLSLLLSCSSPSLILNNVDCTYVLKTKNESIHPLFTPKMITIILYFTQLAPDFDF